MKLMGIERRVERTPEEVVKTIKDNLLELKKRSYTDEVLGRLKSMKKRDKYINMLEKLLTKIINKRYKKYSHR